MKSFTEYSQDLESKVLDYLIDKLTEFDYDGFSVDGYDLHNEVFNTDYVLIGCYEAKEAIAENIHDLFYMLKEYQEEFGECYQDITNVEKVLNLMYYMCGLQLFSAISCLQNDYILEQEDIQNIIKELEAI